MLGIGAMLGMLSDNSETVKAVTSSYGKVIAGVVIDDDELHITFTDKSTLVLADTGQSCCEYRYMNTDDVLSYFVGSVLAKVELEDGPNGDEGEYGDVSESQFLKVTTSAGVFTIVNYNDHNGYYGGFCIEAWIKGAA